MMPAMNGYEALQSIKQNPANRDIPIIMMLCSNRADVDIFHYWQSGVDCFLTKPFNPMELKSFVKRIFQADLPWQEERIPIG